MKVTNAQVLMVNLETQETTQAQVAIPSTFADDNKLMKALVKAYEGSQLKPVHVLSTQVIEKLYGMSEKTFLDNAKELDPETRRALTSVADEA